jgi:hypothetical protein
MCYNNIKIKKERGKKMYTLTVEHKYCKCTRVIKGESISRAYKENDLNPLFWNVVEVSYEG